METHYLILGIIQGLTEFLPVSSSGHLVLFERWFVQGVSNSSLLLMNVFFHMGTLLSVLLFFRKDLWIYIKESISWLKAPTRNTNPIQTEVGMIILLTIPTGLIGLAMKKGGIAHISVNGVLSALCVTGLLCIIIDRLNPAGRDQISWKQALFLGVIQGLAVVPGISRSGSTIFAGLLIGASREKMASFSFLMSIPAICAAFLLELKEAYEAGGATDIDSLSLFLGFSLSFIVGYLSLILLISLLKKKNFKIFGIYCLSLAILAGFGWIQPS